MRRRFSFFARRARFFLPLPAAALLLAACRAHPGWAAALTAHVYAPCWRLLGRAAAYLPLPACWALAGGFALFAALCVFRRRFGRALAAVLTALAVFLGGWGVSCQKAPLAAQITSERISLEQLCAQLAAAADENACAAPDADAIFAAVPASLDAAADRLGIPAGGFAAPRASGLSSLLTRLFTEGIFIPFTGEALVNEAMPACCLPFVACHEAAHARGVAREEDANLAAYLACSLSDDAFFRFSGAVCALSFALDDLRAADAAAYSRVCGALSGRTRDALCARSAFWEPYRGTRAAAAAVSVNEGYLFSIGAQESGTAAYGEFVERMLGND